MTELTVWLDRAGTAAPVGRLAVFSTRGQERYTFTYADTWLADPAGFAIDPLLAKSTAPFSASALWGAFQDISPDRWGRLVQDRAADRYLSDADYMLGVSDYMRLGALRLSTTDAPAVFLAEHREVPKLVQLRALENAVRRLEAGRETPDDLALLAQPGSSLGGAHPKAAVEHDGALWIAKFQSRFDSERVGLWEAVALDLANQAGIPTAPFQVVGADGERPVLLVRRFDRDGARRTPFWSAMTMLEYGEASRDRDRASYLELVDALARYGAQPQADRAQLWQRMTFSALIGNTDDHLRNHGFLRAASGWRLSPAYDLNPDATPYARRRHALSFDGEHARPSLGLCRELAPYFELTDAEVSGQLRRLAAALGAWRATAQRYGLQPNEIQRMATAFEHSDSALLLDLAGPASAAANPARKPPGPAPGA